MRELYAFPSGSDTLAPAVRRLSSDALTAEPAAVKEGGPVLLSDGRALHPTVRAELERLAPARIVIVGGPISISISTDVEQELNSIPPTERIGGADRYEVGRNLAAVGSRTGRTAYSRPRARASPTR